MKESSEIRKGWRWVPSLYLAEGLPYVIITVVSVVMYKNLGISNAEIAFFTSWFYLPWVIKPLWSPWVDLVRTKRWWVVVTQTILAVGFAAVAFLLPTSFFFQGTVAVFWLLAFASATHDIAADGYYMLAQNENDQSFFVGVRNVFYRVAMIVGQGLLVMLAGFLSKSFGHIATAWMVTLLILAGVMLALAIYHRFALPQEMSVAQESETRSSVKELFGSFFRKKRVGIALLFILLYRLGEAQLGKMSSPFLLDSMENGGLAMNNEQVGFIYGTVGVVALLSGGLLGGFLAARDGLKRWLWVMVLSMNVPNLVYVFLAMTQMNNFYLVLSCVAIEQLGYGFGFTAFTLYLIQFAQGRFKTAHYALCTGFMALGMMLPGMASGYVQEAIGYSWFFVYVLICCVPGMLIVNWLDIRESKDVKDVKSAQ